MAETLDSLKVRIRELEKEVERWKSQVKNVRYGLNWMNVPEAFDKDSEDKIPILEEVVEKSVDAEGPLAGRPPHVIIEGDNYHALTCLNYTHRSKIDIIYIDPPYNTGSDGFTYKDKRFLTEFPDGQKVPKEHPLRHSYWLSFMEKRLKLAKNLLNDKGVIFISIDDNEQANLKLLCDKVFGEGNFVTTIHVEMSATQGMKVKAAQMGNIVKNAEYILIYSKGGRRNIAQKLLYDYRPEYDEHYSKFLDNYNQIRSLKDVFKAKNPSIKIRNLSQLYAEESTFREFVKNNAEQIFADDKIVGFNKDEFEIGKVYKIQRNDKTYYLYNNGNKLRQLLCLKSSFGSCDNFNKDYGLRKIRGDWWEEFYKDMGNVSKEGNVVYPNGKKPLRLIEQIIKMIGQNKGIILDFFAGSGTTLHATINQNKEDEGSRQCILIQSPDLTYEIKKGKKISKKGAEEVFDAGFERIVDVTHQRCKNVIQGFTNAKGKSVEGLGGSLKYYKTGFVGKHQSKNANDADKVELAEKAGCLIALAENTLETIKVPKAAKGFWQIYSDNAEKKKRYTCIYHNGDYGKVSDFVEKIDELRATDRKSKFMVYVFSWNSPDFFENEFDDLKNIEIKAIPKPILEIYKALNG